MDFTKAIRTLQSEFPLLKNAKDAFYLYSRRALRRPHEHDFEALKLFPIESSGCFVDVGANHGQSVESIRLFRPEAPIVSFEPNPGLARHLAARYVHQTNIRVIAKGLSDSAGRFTLFVPSYKGFLYDALASLDEEAARTWISQQTVYGFDPTKLEIAPIDCQVDTLDAQQLTPVFLKIDVQGFEYNVLNGGRETLQRCEPIILIESFSSDPRTVRLAGELGYEEYHLRNSTFVKGPPVDTPNSFLITRQRLAALSDLPRRSVDHAQDRKAVTSPR